MDPLTSQIIAFVFGVAAFVGLIVLAFKLPSPTPFQYSTLRIAIALAAAGVAAILPGFMNLEGQPSSGWIVRSGGALAVFLIVYFFDPAGRATRTAEDSKPLGANPEPLKNPAPLVQVAAVCYRRAATSPEFLLVRTTGGRWTFPKGNVDAGEQRWFAAQREAFEEAGAAGEIDHEPFTTYLHEKKEWKDKGTSIKIEAFLLKVEKTQPAESKRRKPTWFSAAEAEEALVADRGFKYAEEFRRVLKEAVSRIE